MASSFSPDAFPLPRLSLRAEGGALRAVVGPALGVTFYLADAFFWADEGIVRALELFFGGALRQRLRVYTTSLLDRWRPLAADSLGEVLAAVAREKKLVRGPRHLFSLSVADQPEVPETSLTYTEIDPRLSQATSVLELTLPALEAPALLLEFSRRIAALGPFFCGVGGFVVRFNPLFRRQAFDELFVWARRYLGLDVQVPTEASWYASSALPGSNWLNFVGAPWADRKELDLAAWLARTWSTPGVSCTPVRPGDARGGVLVRAGELPTLGDRNQLVWPTAYAEVARALFEHFPEEIPSFWGAFHQREMTMPWLRRFVSPKEWT